MTLALVIALFLLLIGLGTIWLLVYRETEADLPAAKLHRSIRSPVRKHKHHHV